jgi:hypothetical protein
MGTCRQVDNKAYKHNVQVDVDISTARNRISGLKYMVSGVEFLDHHWHGIR